MSDRLDPAAATAAYMAMVTPAAHARATAYTQGGHLVLLEGFVASVIAAVVILRSGLLGRLADAVGRRGPRPRLISFTVVAAFYLLDFVIETPFAAYAHWWRERAFGLTSQSFAGWLAEAVLLAVISAVAAGVFFTALYALMKWSRRWWWLYAAGLAAAAVSFAMLAAPVVVEPLFNRYVPAPEGPVRDAVVALARASGTPSDKILIFDGSRQSNRYTANVAGLGGSARIAMSDVMFKKGADVEEVRGVVGHEMGHYRHLHVVVTTIVLSVASIALFGLIALLFPSAARWLRSPSLTVSDPLNFPVLAVLLAAAGLIATPFLNTMTRLEEADADRFSLATANAPDGLARALVKTIDYRASSPGPIEEMVFYDHPSVERRVRAAMEWKAAHPPAP